MERYYVYPFPQASPQPPVHKGQLKDMSADQIAAANYLTKKKIFEFFNFLIGHLLCQGPSDPISMLDDLLDQCMLFRDASGDPPLLFTPVHIAALFRAFDPSDTGAITPQQYNTGMVTMGICQFNKSPPLDENGQVTRETFCEEAERQLTGNLSSMLEVSPYVRDVTPYTSSIMTTDTTIVPLTPKPTLFMREGQVKF